MAVEDHNLELRAQHQESLRDFSPSNTPVQQWLSGKKIETSKPTGQGRDQMDRVMYFLATGREAVQKAGGAASSLADIKDALENQKTRQRIDSHWTRKIENSHKDLQWISKYRHKDKSRQLEKASSQRATLPWAGNSGSGEAADPLHIATPLSSRHDTGESDKQIKDAQVRLQLNAQACPSYMAANESWRRRNAGWKLPLRDRRGKVDHAT